MGIKTFETRNALKNKLHNRSLIFAEKEMDEILISHNLFFIIPLTFHSSTSKMQITNESLLRALSNGGIAFDKKPSTTC